MTRRDLPEMCSDEAREQGCTCHMSYVHSASIDPPYPVLNEWCLVHGRDPDEEYERRRDDRRDFWE